MHVRRSVAFAALLLVLLAAPVVAGEFVDAAGRRVLLPDRIARILPAERNAEVLILVMAPDKLVGLSQVPSRGALVPRGSRLPVFAWRPRSDPASMAATVLHLRPDLVIDAGTVTPDRAAFADRVQPP